MRKKFMISLSCIFLCILILQISPIRGANFILEDEIADLEYFNDGTTVNPGPGVHDEIDIVSLEINGVSIVVTYVAAPIKSLDYSYTAQIYWIGDDDIGNWTKYQWDGDDNYAHTRIENGTGGEIIDEYAYDVIDPVGLTLVFPIYHTDKIPTILDPHIVVTSALYQVSVGEYYVDEIGYGPGTYSRRGLPFPGFEIWISISCLSLIVMINLVMNKKKN
ncbi:MAG: hypothetical protein FK733_15105 [Asgard group archaeon]|nr:hypothetical protein [Asgard group archaeon]